MKKNKKGTNLIFGSLSAIRGNPIIQIEAPIRLVIVEYGIIFGYTIYGIYNQTIGPRVRPKNVINIHIPIIMMIDHTCDSP